MGEASPEQKMVVIINMYSQCITSVPELVKVISRLQRQYNVIDSAVSVMYKDYHEAYIDRLGEHNRFRDREEGTISFITSDMQFAIYQGRCITIKEYKAILMTMGFPP